MTTIKTSIQKKIEDLKLEIKEKEATLAIADFLDTELKGIVFDDVWYWRAFIKLKSFPEVAITLRKLMNTKLPDGYSWNKREPSVTPRKIESGFTFDYTQDVEIIHDSERVYEFQLQLNGLLRNELPKDIVGPKCEVKESVYVSHYVSCPVE
jgi:hypothetical protein